MEKKNSRLRELDFLRGIAIILVLFRHHLHNGLTDSNGFILFIERMGWIGVDLFFVLSGFLIGKILLKMITETDFTKRDLINLIINELDIKETDICYDPSCGTGGFLLGFANKYKTTTGSGHDWTTIWLYPAAIAGAVLIAFILFFKEKKEVEAA